MKTRVKLRDGCKINQPMTQHEWKFGYVDGYCRAADNRCYAIVVTDHNEFEFVPVNLIVACGNTVKAGG
jgi:hypothetical protein